MSPSRLHVAAPLRVGGHHPALHQCLLPLAWIYRHFPPLGGVFFIDYWEIRWLLTMLNKQILKVSHPGAPWMVSWSLTFVTNPCLQWQMSLWLFFFGSYLGTQFAFCGPYRKWSACPDQLPHGPRWLSSCCPGDVCLHHLFEVCPGLLQVLCSCAREPELSLLQTHFWHDEKPVTFSHEDVHPSSILISFLHFFHLGLFFSCLLILICWWWMLLLFVSFTVILEGISMGSFPRVEDLGFSFDKLIIVALEKPLDCIYGFFRGNLFLSF